MTRMQRGKRVGLLRSVYYGGRLITKALKEPQATRPQGAVTRGKGPNAVR